MKQTVNNTAFHDAFIAYGRQDNFSYDARDLLFEYFEQLEDETGSEIELDVVAICCEYTEETLENVVSNYDIDISYCEGILEKIEAVTDYLIENTQLIGVTGNNTFVYLAF